MSAWQTDLAGARLLDLFAGSGAVGLEAIGRGAAVVVGLESSSRALRQLRASYARCSGDRAEARRAVLPGELGSRAGAEPYDLAFADPPYDFDRFEELLQECSTLLVTRGEVAIEHSSRADLPTRVGGLGLDRSRRYGESVLSFYRFADEECDGD